MTKKRTKARPQESKKPVVQSGKQELSSEELDGVVGGALTATEIGLTEPPEPELGGTLLSPAQRWVVGRWTVK